MLEYRCKVMMKLTTIGIGSAFTRAGPLSVLLGYTFTGLAVFAMMQCLGEMATWLPLPGSIPQFCARYCDDALRFAVGWNVSPMSHHRLECELLPKLPSRFKSIGVKIILVLMSDLSSKSERSLDDNDLLSSLS